MRDELLMSPLLHPKLYEHGDLPYHWHLKVLSKSAHEWLSFSLLYSTPAWEILCPNKHILRLLKEISFPILSLKEETWDQQFAMAVFWWWFQPFGGGTGLPSALSG